MSGYDRVKNDYDNTASTYNSHVETPQGILELQLLELALGDCSGAVVLDLAGGTGIQARMVINAGAVAVDVVDISPEMMKIGKATEVALSRDKITWHEADISKPLDHLPFFPHTYDIVMANWAFDHTPSLEALEGIWANISLYLKPGGKFVGVRVADPYSPAVLDTDKYGVRLTNVEPIPGGVKYICKLLGEPPVEFEGSTMDVSWKSERMSEMHEKAGLVNVEVVPWEEVEIVKRDRTGFWDEALARRFMEVITGRKKMN